MLNKAFKLWLEKKFYPLIDKQDCWQWQGNIDRGFGRVYYRGRRTSAHRLSYLITHQRSDAHKFQLPKGARIQQLCSNKLCCNPDHLKLVVENQELTA